LWLKIVFLCADASFLQAQISKYLKCRVSKKIISKALTGWYRNCILDCRVKDWAEDLAVKVFLFIQGIRNEKTTYTYRIEKLR